MATILRSTTTTSIGAPSRQFGPSRRLGIVGGALVATVAAAAILVSTGFPQTAPIALPIQSHSFAFHDRTVAPVPIALPVMTYSFSFHDRVAAPTTQSLAAVSHGVGFHDRIQALAPGAVSVTSHSLALEYRN